MGTVVDNVWKGFIGPRAPSANFFFLVLARNRAIKINYPQPSRMDELPVGKLEEVTSTYKM